MRPGAASTLFADEAAGAVWRLPVKCAAEQCERRYGRQATTGLLFAKTLSVAAQNPYLAGAAFNPVLALDIFLVQAGCRTRHTTRLPNPVHDPASEPGTQPGFRTRHRTQRTGRHTTDLHTWHIGRALHFLRTPRECWISGTAGRHRARLTNPPRKPAAQARPAQRSAPERPPLCSRCCTHLRSSAGQPSSAARTCGRARRSWRRRSTPVAVGGKSARLCAFGWSAEQSHGDRTQAAANVLLAHFIGGAVSLWLLRSISD